MRHRFMSSVGAGLSSLSPGMKQYQELKKLSHPHLLMFQLGDFFEMFGADAEKASALLGIALTQRRAQKGGASIPMAGVPVHAAEGYIGKLLRMGLTVAVAEQMESPSEAKASGRRIVSRSITRVITPGTVVDDSMLPEEGESSYLLALDRTVRESGSHVWKVLWTDVSTGRGGARLVENQQEAITLVSALQPREILVTSSVDESLATAISHCARNSRVVPSTAVEATDAVVAYLKDTLYRPSSIEECHIGSAGSESLKTMTADALTREALDLVRSTAGASRSDSARGSVFHLFTSCHHAYSVPALRLLRTRLLHPLHPDEIGTIERRLERIKWLVSREDFLRTMRKKLGSLHSCGDAERALQRIILSVHRSSLHLSRDLKAVACALKAAEAMAPLACNMWPELSGPMSSQLWKWASETLSLVGAEDSNISTDGGVCQGADAELDALRDPRASTKEIEEVEMRLSSELGIPIKITRPAKGANADELYLSVADRHTEHLGQRVREGSLKAMYAGQRAGYTRWVVAELTEIGKRLAKVEELIQQRIDVLLKKRRQSLVQNLAECRAMLDALWDLDLSCGVAHCSQSLNLAVPRLTEARDALLQLHGVFHPVLRHLHAQVTPNNMHMQADPTYSLPRALVVTGPNMGGKTTLLRAVALAVWLTQCGLPCGVAPDSTVSLFHSLFVRCGSYDDITRDRSTFYAEMQGVGALVQQTSSANSRTLVTLDELGRSTAPLEGAAICASVIRFLATQNALSLVATHYQAVASLWSRRLLGPGIDLKHFHVIETDGAHPVFTHELRPGPCPASHALHVAAQAGVPGSIIEDATFIMKNLFNEKD